MSEEHTYLMSCKDCGYLYTYKGVERKGESCPLCPHTGSFDEFVDMEVKSEPERRDKTFIGS